MHVPGRDLPGPLRRSLLSPLRRSLAVVGLLASVMVSSAGAGFFVVETGAQARRIKAQIRAAQFLHRATFGPTWEQVEELATRMQQVGERQAMNDWIDEQF